MKVLFSALHHAYFRNFESVVRDLAACGHRVHLSAEEPESLGGQSLAERLAAEYPGVVTWDFVPAVNDEPWADAARRLRVGLDYVRALEPRYRSSPKLRLRSEERAPRIVRWTARMPGIGRRATRAALTRVERLLPRSERIEAYLRQHSPDVLVLASLTYSRSRQIDQLKAARALGIPVAAAIMSWDHLSSKALLHLAPDRVLVWNEVQRREAVEMHNLSAERIVVTGAQCYDQWFTRQPARGREAFCQAVGLRADRRFVLWVHSAFSPAIEPPEPDLVLRWLAALRHSRNGSLRDLGVLIRPHPERVREWSGVPLDRFENVAFRGGNPIDSASKDEYFDALFHSAAVVGLATSAFLEAAIVGRPVLTITPPEYRMHQEGMAHFQYLQTVEGGVLHSAPDLERHLEQLAAAIAGTGRDERNRRFLTAFVRPSGLDVPATPIVTKAIERLAAAGPFTDATLDEYAWLRPIVGAVARRAGGGLVRWLLLDRRGDAVDEELERRRLVTDARIAKREAYRQAKSRRAGEERRRDSRRARVKSSMSVLRRARYAVAVTAHRALAAAGFRRPGEMSDAGKH